ncbi:MAG: hypothetical protein WC966_07900 [Bradymonadales bacterium]|jgi:hypothetical protein
MKKFCVRLLIVLIGAVFVSCTTTAVARLETPERSISPSKDYDKTTGQRLIFEPRTSFVVGLGANSGFERGAWVGAKPTEHWPSSEPAPSLFLGQVVERHKTWARVEVLSVTDSIRHEALNPAEVSADLLPSITKRLVYSLSPTPSSQRELEVAIGHDNLRSEHELYVAIDLDESAKLRFGARIKGIFSLKAKDASISRLELLAGSIPANAAYVLLGANIPSSIQTVIGSDGGACLSGTLNELERSLESEEVKRLFSDTLILATKNSKKSANTESKALKTQQLAIKLSCDEGLAKLNSELYRLSLLEPAAQLRSDVPSNLNSCAILAHAAQMSGNYPNVIFIAERCLAEHASVEAYAMLSSVLVYAYSAVERPDWGLELALSLQDLNKRSAKNGALLLSELEAWSILANKDEARRLVEILRPMASRMNAQQVEAVLKSLLRLYRNGVEELSSELDFWARSMRKNHKNSDPKLLCLVQALGDVDMEYCEQMRSSSDALSHSYGRGLLTFSNLASALSDESIDMIKQLSSLFLPALSTLILQAAATLSQNDESYIQLMHGASLQLWEAQRYSAFVSLFAGMEELYFSAKKKLFDGSASREYLSLLATMDKRTRLSRRSMRQALDPATPQDDAINLLKLCTELAISTGDEENAAIAYAHLSRAYRRAKLHDKAEVAMQRARDFAKNTRHPDILHLLTD